MRPHIAQFLLGCMAWAVCGAEQSPHSEEPAAALALKAAAAWRDYSPAVLNVQGVYSLRSIDNGVPSATQRAYHVRRNGPNLLIMSFIEDTDRSVAARRRDRSVRCNNSRYSFELVEGTGAKPWAVTSIEPLPGGKPKELGWSRALLALGPRVGLPPLPDALSKPEFRIESLRREPEEGDGCYALKFSWQSAGRALVGTAILDASHYWCIKGAHFEERADSVTYLRGTVKCEYNIVEGVPIPRQRTTDYTLSVGGKESDHVWIETFDFTIPASLPAESDFTLSAFGLEEPWGVIWPQPPTPWFLYFSAGGFGLFFLAFFLWRVLAKRQARGVA